MSNFIYNSYCVEHPGVVHVYQAADDRKSAVKRFSGKRGASALLLAALVAALMVVVNEVAHNWTDGHMLGAWVVLWVAAFMGLALFSAPARRAAMMARAGYRAWTESRQQAAADARIWNAALQDARLMADLARAMDRQGS
ncbi:hypothetical protein [Delftia tsuruhatensis]|uniref:hypothetical protein n=1 Tax=Delftia tsuruhatensis TaxID=180282 RepID=UPI002AD30A6B|nr:hypothetical protein [Delftia tsuruhatensis]WQM83364.1 hypothetical protein RNT40_00515 [Delftia tsuruhatensis]